MHLSSARNALLRRDPARGAFLQRIIGGCSKLSQGHCPLAHDVTPLVHLTHQAVGITYQFAEQPLPVIVAKHFIMEKHNLGSQRRSIRSRCHH